jgi:hypothetical protein
VGFDQLSQTSGVVMAIISSPRGARAPIDAERRGIEVQALVGVLTTDLVSIDAVSIDFSEAWPSTSSVATDEAQLTRNPFLEGPGERLDFLSIGLWKLEGRFGVLRVEAFDAKLDFRSFLLSRIGGIAISTFSSFLRLSRSSRARSFFLIRYVNINIKAK